MKLKKIAIVAAMEQEAQAICPAPQHKTLGKYQLLCGTLKNNVSYRCIISGIGTARAAEAAKLLCAEKPDLILSIGVSGGLAAGLEAGTLVTATTIHSDIAEFDSWFEGNEDARQRIELIPACGEIQCGKLITAGEAVLTPQNKLFMHERTGALAVDMESIAVAQAAKKAEIPFGCIRAISDDSKRGIPQESLSGVDESGKTQLSPILKAIMKRPTLIFELIPMGRDYSKALKALGTILK
ncbi:phosphorylase [Desulfovibrio sp. JC022]|uniref:phosphorylase family protein n=1 Tax=Desulfovibrio sp. JC022 TaxID=2593642 RepID=UPI0013D45DCA|nr:phosphorylase [Desulfovibrio sp. JC022]NDV22522.1 phosphorylase [Desulfovibrio sp. JC022]